MEYDESMKYFWVLRADRDVSHSFTLIQNQAIALPHLRNQGLTKVCPRGNPASDRAHRDQHAIARTHLNDRERFLLGQSAHDFTVQIFVVPHVQGTNVLSNVTLSKFDTRIRHGILAHGRALDCKVEHRSVQKSKRRRSELVQ